jgi:hypothetical protein
MIGEMLHHHAFGQLGIFLEERIHDLIMLAHRIVESLRHMQRQQTGFLNFSPQFLDEVLEPLIV